MVDASRGFIKDGNKNRLRSQDIHKIVDVFKHGRELPRYSRAVPVAEIASAANDFNLNIPRYIDASDPEDLHDLDAHLKGGIPARDVDALEDYWRVFPGLRAALFRDAGRPGYSDPCVATEAVKATILDHPEFAAFAGQVAAVVGQWRDAHGDFLWGLLDGEAIQPRAVIHRLSEDLLARFADQPLLSRYAVYQRLMDYWAEVMQDDVFLIGADGWQAAARPRGIIDDKERKIRETPDLVVGKKKYKMDLIPPGLIAAWYFAGDRAAVERLQSEADEAARELEEFVEEHSDEEGLLAEATTDKGKVTRGSVKDRLKALDGDEGLFSPSDDSREEREVLQQCLALIDAESEAARRVKVAQAELDERVLRQYAELSEDEIRDMVVEGKWFATISEAIDGEVQRVTQQLAGRVKELEERYAEPLPALEREVEALGETVMGHLRRMGLEWA